MEFICTIITCVVTLLVMRKTLKKSDEQNEQAIKASDQNNSEAIKSAKEINNITLKHERVSRINLRISESYDTLYSPNFSKIINQIVNYTILDDEEKKKIRLEITDALLDYYGNLENKYQALEMCKGEITLEKQKEIDNILRKITRFKQELNDISLYFNCLILSRSKPKNDYDAYFTYRKEQIDIIKKILDVKSEADIPDNKELWNLVKQNLFLIYDNNQVIMEAYIKKISQRNEDKEIWKFLSIEDINLYGRQKDSSNIGISRLMRNRFDQSYL